MKQEQGTGSTDHSTAISVLPIVVAYAFFSGLWIFLSDQAVELMFSDPAMIARANLFKGWTFVAVTTLLMYVLLRRLANRLREQQHYRNLLAAIADASADAIFAKDEAGRYLLFNPAASRFVGKPAEFVLGKDDRALFPPEQASMLMEINQRVMASGQVEINEEIVDTPGGRRVFLGTKGPLRDANDKVFGTFGLSHDITELKRMEAALRDSETRLRLMIEHLPIALALFDRHMRYLALNRQWCEFFLAEDRDLIGHSHYEIFPDLAESFREAHRRGLAGTVVSSEGDPFERSDGKVIWTRWEVRPWHDASVGGIGGIVVFAEDVSERKRQEQALYESEQRFRTLFNNTGVAITIHDPQSGELIEANRRAIELYGYRTFAEFRDHALWMESPYGCEDVVRWVQRAAAEGLQHFEWQGITRQEAHVWLDVILSVMTLDGVTRVISTAADITARKAAEDGLRARSEELERFNRATVGRELDMLAMKIKINALSRELSRPAPYPLDFLKGEDEKNRP